MFLSSPLPSMGPVPTTTSRNGHSPDKTQAFQPVAPAWRKQTEHGSCGPPACSPQPFPSLAPKQMTSSAGPSSYQLLGLPGTGGGKEPGGRGWPVLWLLWHRPGLCGVSAAAFKSGELQPCSGGSCCLRVATSSSLASTLLRAALGYESDATGSHHLARRKGQKEGPLSLEIKGPFLVLSPNNTMAGPLCLSMLVSSVQPSASLI